MTDNLAADVTDVHGSITRSSVEADLAHGGHKVVLVTGEETTRRSTAWLPADEARELARNLLAQADEADKRNGVVLPEPSDELIIATAGEYWDHYGHADPDDILSTVQFGAIGRAVGQYQMDTEGETEMPVEWAGRTFGQLSPDERVRVTRQAAGKLQAELQANAPAIAQVLADADVAEHRQIENEQQS